MHGGADLGAVVFAVDATCPRTVAGRWVEVEEAEALSCECSVLAVVVIPGLVLVLTPREGGIFMSR